VVISRDGIRIDSEAGWSAPVATDPDECETIAAEFLSVANHLRANPDLVIDWAHRPDKDYANWVERAWDTGYATGLEMARTTQRTREELEAFNRASHGEGEESVGG
jgi:hypothetical protein